MSFLTSRQQLKRLRECEIYDEKDNKKIKLANIPSADFFFHPVFCSFSKPIDEKNNETL